MTDLLAFLQGLSRIVGVWLVVGLVVAALCVVWMRGRERA